MNLLQAIDSEILAFSSRLENATLMPRTRSYSTLFRHTLFGKLLQSEVEAELNQRSVDVLLLNSNPKVRIEGNDDSRFGTLQEQINCGYFGEAYFDEVRRARPGWSPQNDPKVGWKRVFRSIDDAGLDADAVAVANYFPWGSDDLSEFIPDLIRNDPELLRRMVDFANCTLEKVVGLMRPKVIVAVRSLSNTRGLSGSLVAKAQANAREVKLQMPVLKGGTKPVYLYAGQVEIGGHSTLLVHMPHPGYLQLTKAAEPEFVAQLSQLLGRALS